MSNKKIKSLIYTAIVILILAGVGWYLLLRPSKYTDDSVKALFTERREPMQTVAKYLREQKIDTDITDIPTVDHRFGIPVEDTDAYRAFNDAVITLMRTECSEIIANDGTVQFITPKSGGFLCPSYAILVHGEMPPVYLDAAQSDLGQQNWKYYIVTEKGD